MLTQLRKFLTTAATVVVFGTLGIASGNTLLSITAPVPVAAACEEDECEGGSYCFQNSGQSTGCDIISPLECVTYGC